MKPRKTPRPGKNKESGLVPVARRVRPLVVDVTDPTRDAPDGAVVNGMERVGDQRRETGLGPVIKPQLTAGDVENAREVLENVEAENTKIAHENDWKLFSRFCASRSASSLPAHPLTVVAYMMALAKGEIPDHLGRLKPRKLATIHRHLATISTRHTRAELLSPRTTQPVKVALLSIGRMIGEPQRPKKAAVEELLFQMVQTLPDDDHRVRDAAVLLVGFFSAVRRSELVAINIDHIEFERGLASVLIPRSKGDQQGKGQRVELIENVSDSDACAVTAVRKLLEVLPDETDGKGPLFRKIERNGLFSVRLRARAVADLVKACAERLGLDSKRFAGHSLRSGFVTSATLAGATFRDIQHQTRHKNEGTLLRYMQNTASPENHAGARIIRSRDERSKPKD